MAFTQKTLEFLAENRMRNSRDWFHAHKAEYQAHVMQPLVQLSEALAPIMEQIDSQFVTAPKVNKTISRIYRDNRFTKDKSLYREHMWVVFMRDKHLFTEPPALVFEFWPDGYFYGCGYYCASSRVMEAMRQLVLKDDKTYHAAQRALDGQKEFQLDGELYKRPHYPDQPEKKRAWLERRGMSVLHAGADVRDIYDPNLASRLAEGFQALKPVYDFFIASAELSKRG